jgi:hypothetical protein
VGGDVVEVITDGANPRWLVGDTRGKGLPALRLASVAATSFRDACAQPGLSLSEVARAVDLSVTRAAGEEDFVTAVFAELDPAGWIQLVDCGHPPPLRLSTDGELVPLAPAVFAAPLGLHPDLRIATFSVRAGDRLLFFTDGLLEARDRRGRFFRVDQQIQALADRTCKQPSTSCWTGCARTPGAGSTTTSPCCWLNLPSPTPAPDFSRPGQVRGPPDRGQPVPEVQGRLDADRAHLRPHASLGERGGHAAVEDDRLHRRCGGQHGDHHVRVPHRVRADAAAVAPASARAAAAAADPSQTRVSRPAAARFRAIADPMMPAPITATTVRNTRDFRCFGLSGV